MNNPVYSLSNFIGDFPFTIDGVISFACKYYPNKEAVVAQNSSLTYSNLNNAINNFAFTLQKNGIKRYDRIALVLSNTPEFVIGLFGIIRTGAIPLLIFPQIKVPEFEETVIKSQTKAVVTDINGYKRFSLILEKKHLPLFLFNNQELDIPAVCFDYRISEIHIPIIQSPSIDIDPAIIVFTSGTSKSPKGVVLNHKNLLTNCISNIKAIGMNEEDSTLIILPLTHLYSLSHQLFCTLFTGGTLHLIDAMFLPHLFYKYLDNVNITWFAGTPSVFYSIIKYNESQSNKPKAADSLRMLTIGGGAISPPAVKKLERLFPNTNLIITYGLTENSPRVSTYYYSENKDKLGTVGKALPNVEVLQNIKPEEDGAFNLIVRGSTVMYGYIDSSGEIVRRNSDELNTGDIGFVDSDGYVQIVGRNKKIINSAGYKIQPAEVERIINSFPGILDSTVYGSPHDIYGEAVHCSVILEEGKNITKRDLISFCRKYLTDYKIPKYFKLTFTPKLNSNHKFVHEI